jgi:hypothetical protein
MVELPTRLSSDTDEHAGVSYATARRDRVRDQLPATVDRELFQEIERLGVPQIEPKKMSCSIQIWAQ